MTPPRLDPATIDWNKGDGLVPAVVQHASSGEVLMLGYMNAAALVHTQDTGQVTFWSRSKQRLWTKGETSAHVLQLVTVRRDCDADALLVQALPQGPTCHTGATSCFGEQSGPALAWLAHLEDLIGRREQERPAGSYVARLFDKGLHKIAQKVGEEGVETALAGVAQDDAALTGEAADLLFHLVVLLRARGVPLASVLTELQHRHR